MFKTFIPGPLASSDVNNYLMNQANIGATSSTLPTSPQAGMVVYESDTDSWIYYNGTTWRPHGNDPSQTVQYAAAIPSSPLTADLTGSMSDWFTIGSVTVPSWATKAVLSVLINGCFEITAAGNSYLTQMKVGSAVGTAVYQPFGQGSVSQRFNLTSMDLVTGLTAATVNVIIRSQQHSGSGGWRVDTNSRAAFTATFLP